MVSHYGMRKMEQKTMRKNIEAAREAKKERNKKIWEAIEKFEPLPEDAENFKPEKLYEPGEFVEGFEFESIEVSVQEQRELSVLEVFSSKEGEPVKEPEEFLSSTEDEAAKPAFIPLYSTKDFQTFVRPQLRDIILDEERAGEFDSANLSAGPVPDEIVKGAQKMLDFMSSEQHAELRVLFPSDNPTSSMLQFDKLWSKLDETETQGEDGELPEAFKDLPPAVISWLAENEDVTQQLIDNETLEIDREKLKMTVEALYIKGLVARPAPAAAAAVDPHAEYQKHMQALNNQGLSRGGLGASAGVRPPSMQQPQQPMLNSNSIPPDNLIVVVMVNK